MSAFKALNGRMLFQNACTSSVQCEDVGSALPTTYMVMSRWPGWNASDAAHGITVPALVSM